MSEVIKSARIERRTLHLTFFDLADAFGSVPHELIRLTLEKHGLPNNIQGYMDKVLDNGWASVNVGFGSMTMGITVVLRHLNLVSDGYCLVYGFV